MAPLSRQDIQRLLTLLNEELSTQSLKGEVYLVGGAVMCLVFQTRPATKDVDAYFQPAAKIREAAREVAAKTGLGEDWLNDAVKGYLSQQGRFDSFLDMSHLKVFTCRPDYLLAMKCLAMRIGEEFHDLEDIRYLIRYLNITTYQEALNKIALYYPLDRFPKKTLYALEEIFQS